jgi:ribosome-associated protein
MAALPVFLSSVSVARFHRPDFIVRFHRRFAVRFHSPPDLRAPPTSRMSRASRPFQHDGTDGDAALPPEPPSKTQRKQASHELQSLGEAAAALPEERVRALTVSEALVEALLELRRTRSHEARRRQLQYVGKLMRREEDAEPVRQAVAEQQLGRAHDSLALHEAERWRAELIAGDEAATRWAAQRPGTDVQQLRSLVRAARRDAALQPEQRSGRAYRELFQFIKQHIRDE